MNDTSPPDPSAGNGVPAREIRLLDQYESEMKQLTDALSEADPQSSKQIQKQIDQKKLVYWKQITLVQTQWPEATEGKLHEAGYYAAEALTLLFGSGAMRRASDRAGNPAMKIATGLIAKGQEAGNRTKALALIDKALAIVDHPFARYVKACALVDKGEKPAALAELDHIIAQFGDDEDVYMQARKLKDEIENPAKKRGCIGCFIATAAYGSPLASEVVLLSRFRDDVLLHSGAGRLFVALYYRLSPATAKFISRHDLLRAMTRGFVISPILRTLRLVGLAR